MQRRRQAINMWVPIAKKEQTSKHQKTDENIVRNTGNGIRKT